MHRRGILGLAAIGSLFAAAKSAPARAAQPDAAKVVYHLSDFAKVGFVLGNIKNHYEGAGGPDKVRITLVVHGQALKAFHAKEGNADVARRLAGYVKDGLGLYACRNTMRGQGVDIADLLPGFAPAERGGVVLLAELQAQGYTYLRP